MDGKNFIIHYGDLLDSSNLTWIIQEVQSDEVYSLAAQSYVAVSFETHEYYADMDRLGTMCILELMRIINSQAKSKFYQTSSIERYGLV